MTRQDYINHLDALRKGVEKIVKFDQEEKDKNGRLSNPTPLEDERAKKTQKMLDDLVIRLYEDAAVSEKVKQEKLLASNRPRSPSPPRWRRGRPRTWRSVRRRKAVRSERARNEPFVRRLHPHGHVQGGGYRENRSKRCSWAYAPSLSGTLTV